MRQDEMIPALERHEAGAGESTREHQATLEGHASVAATVQDERGNSDARQQVRDVDVPDDAPQPDGGVGRCGNSLQFVEVSATRTPVEVVEDLVRGVLAPGI
jgi:hypothetical protein